MDTDGCILFLSLAAAVLVIRAIFSAFENAVTEISDQALKSLASSSKKYKRLSQLSSNPTKMLLTFSAHRVISACVCASCALIAAIGYISEHAPNLIENKAVFAVGTVLCVVVFCVLMMILTDFLPKTLTEKSSNSFAAFASTPVSLLITLYSPLTFVLALADKGLRRLAGLNAKRKNEIVTEEKILMMLEAGNETGVIESSEKEMINNIFEFDDVCVNEVMTHRTELVAVDAETPAQELVKLAIEEGFSRIPVYENSIDSIAGVVYVKDLLCLIVDGTDKSLSVRNFMREALYVPETNTCAEVFDSLSTSKSHFAVVVDEYGGTAGIVTMEDLIEEIVGNIQDEYDDEESEFSCIADNVYSVSGSAAPDDVFAQLGTALPENCEYATMNALYVDILGRIPEKDETPKVEFLNLELMPTLVEDNWVSRIKITKIEEQTENSEEE